MSVIRVLSLFILPAILCPAARAAEARIMEGPYLQAVNENGFTVVWTTGVEATGWVEVAPDDGSAWYATSRPRFYNSIDGRKAIGTVQRVAVDGLEPGTGYRYRLFNQHYARVEGKRHPQAVSVFASQIFRGSPFNVKTLDPDREKICFAVVNDIHDSDSIFRNLVMPVADGIDFLIMNGDMNSFIDNESQLFDGYLRSAAEVSAAGVPIFMARGNHETRGTFAHRYMDYFPSVTERPYYTFRHGPAFFIVLDGAEDKPDGDVEYNGLGDYDRYRQQQVEWLAGVVGGEEFRDAPVKIVIVHMPPTPDGWHGPREVQRLFVPLLDGAGIDLMLCGHTAGKYFEPGPGRDFPYLINVKTHRAVIEADRNNVTVSTYDCEGKKHLNISLHTKSSEQR